MNSGQINTEKSELDTITMWMELASSGQLKVIDLLKRAQDLELVGKTIRWKTYFHPTNKNIHDMVIRKLEHYGAIVERVIL